MTQVAKIFTNGRSQAVRLPAAYRLDTKEVFIRQDAETSDVILSRRPTTWDGFFAALQEFWSLRLRRMSIWCLTLKSQTITF